MNCSHLLAAFLAGFSVASAAPVLSVNPAAGIPGTTVQVAVGDTTDTNTPSLQFDLLYATNYLATGTPAGGNALSDHQVASSEPAPGVRRVLIFSFSNAALTNGVLAYVPFMIATNAPDHDQPLTLSNVVVSSAQANQVTAYSSNGVLVVAIPPRITSLVRTNGAVLLQLSGTSARAYRLDAQTNPAAPQWTALATNTASNGTAEFEDTAAAGFGFRFYRAALAR
jgi:hypothetical protein